MVTLNKFGFEKSDGKGDQSFINFFCTVGPSGETSTISNVIIVGNWVSSIVSGFSNFVLEVLVDTLYTTTKLSGTFHCSTLIGNVYIILSDISGDLGILGMKVTMWISVLGMIFIFLATYHSFQIDIYKNKIA